MALLTQWTWVWVNSRSWWWTGRPVVLWFMRSQRVGHDWATELNWTESHLFLYLPISDKKAQVLSSLGQKEVHIIQALTYMQISPALSPFTTLKAKPVSLPCSIQLFFNLLESLLFSPQKNSLCEWWIFSYSLGVYVISLSIQTELSLKDPSCLCGVMAAIGPKSRILRCCPLPPGVSSLFFGFHTGSAVAGEHAIWAPSVWLACAFTLLLCAAFVSAC